MFKGDHDRRVTICSTRGGLRRAGAATIASIPDIVPSRRHAMKMLIRLLAGVLLLAILGGIVFLASWDIPAPFQRIERTLPDDRFPR